MFFRPATVWRECAYYGFRHAVFSMRRRAFLVTLTAATIALASLVAAPHYHADDDSAVSDPDTSCCVCQLSDGLAATPPLRCALPVVPVVMRLQPRRAPCLALTCVVGRIESSRAPPSGEMTLGVI